MKKTIPVIMMILLCPAAWATPPGDVNVAYDLEKQTLTVSGPHPTQEITEHYIRKFEVTVNNGAPQMFYFPKQSSAAEFSEALPVKIKPNDQIHVKVSCSQGGSKEADLHIPEAKPEEKPPADLKAIKDKDHDNIQVIP